MNRSKNCTGMHRVLLVDQWTEQGAQVSCLLCPTSFHADYEFLERFYSDFHHNSGLGQDEDKDVMILDKVL